MMPAGGVRLDQFFPPSLETFTRFFFFQAEDGIRDLYVTGVQTCALPISTLVLALPAAYARVSFLEAGGHSGVAFTFIVHHSDGSTESGSGSIPDWFNGAG